MQSGTRPSAVVPTSDTTPSCTPRLQSQQLRGLLSHPMARDILAVLPYDEVDAVLSDLPRMT